MTHKIPLEIAVFEALLKRVLEPKSDGRPTVVLLGEELVAVSEVEQTASIALLFRHVETIDRLISELMAGQKRTRAGERLKARIATLFTPDMLARPYNEFQKIQRQNVEAIIDLMAFLEHLEFDNEKFEIKVPELDEQLSGIVKKVAQDSDLSEAQQRVVLAQVELMRRSLGRFRLGGVSDFRDSILCGIGRLHIELRSTTGKQADSVRGFIDDFLRVKEVAESAGGALALTGPYIAGYLTGPAIG